mmetsp:Transcript_34061/g.48397  ORF Transcript_34061/g.48397 Transcript_34061/m.48397 type:complete len:154 (+) Transcript_34061:185-646(+)
MLDLGDKCCCCCEEEESKDRYPLPGDAGASREDPENEEVESVEVDAPQLARWCCCCDRCLRSLAFSLIVSSVVLVLVIDDDEDGLPMAFMSVVSLSILVFWMYLFRKERDLDGLVFVLGLAFLVGGVLFFSVGDDGDGLDALSGDCDRYLDGL